MIKDGHVIASEKVENGTILKVFIPESIDLDEDLHKCSMEILDGRTITRKQQRFIYAMFNDIAYWNGDVPEFIKVFMKALFKTERYKQDFSLSDVDIKTANEFIDFILEFCFSNRIPLAKGTIDKVTSITRYLYMCIKYRVCSVCGREHAHIHHEQAIGNRKRKSYDHTQSDLIALCYECHERAHKLGRQTFRNKYHVYGIKIDKELVKELNL